ncbi:acyl-coenzyme A synthetase ACSM3, mitochondrial-like [Clytia hemisphaerica]|uniref:medium-chain acyl-CoA ligase n=1 Tax=Clytia hemisphaerica TaxID=252671 RepID=A0A7M5WVQ0_9CNID
MQRFIQRHVGNKIKKYVFHYKTTRLNTSTLSSAAGFNNYDEAVKNYTCEVPNDFNFAEQVLEEWKRKEQLGKRDANHPAFWWVDDAGNELQYSFSELLAQSNKVSNILYGDLGIQKGECVIVVLPRIPEWWLVNIACLKIGAILCPGTTSLTAKDLFGRLNASRATCIITTPEIASLVDQIPDVDVPNLKRKISVGGAERDGWLPMHSLMRNASPEFKTLPCKSEDPMSWFFTSGTTGLPKMTEHTHASYGFAHRDTGRYWLDLTENDTMWNLSDTGWAKSAYSSVYAPWWQGSCVFVYNAPRFDAKETLRVLEKYSISVTCLPPTAYRMFANEDVSSYKFKALRHCVSAGEPLNPEIIDYWYRTTGISIREGYGQTEMTLSCGMFRCLDMKAGSMGKPTPGYDIQIIDNKGNKMKPGEEGNVAVNCSPKPPVGLFSKYVDDPERTSAAFCGNFYLTGDRGYMDEDGYLWFVGRADDVIISSGYRIGPFEVESVLIEHPEVAESAVVSSPCDVRGEVVKAFVIPTKPLDEIDAETLTVELQDHVKKSTAPYKYPRKIEFVDSLPKTISGKIRRVELRAKEWS